MQRLGFPEWYVSTVQAMYSKASSRVCVNNSLSNSFTVQVGVHQGSVLSPFLFIVVLEALSCEFRTGCPWELLYADDLVISSDSLDDLLERLRIWKMGLESKGLCVNMCKTKILMSGPNLDFLCDSEVTPSTVMVAPIGCTRNAATYPADYIQTLCSSVADAEVQHGQSMAGLVNASW